jgi:bacterioferritin-associated ferredoxin
MNDSEKISILVEALSYARAGFKVLAEGCPTGAKCSQCQQVAKENDAELAIALIKVGEAE